MLRLANPGDYGLVGLPPRAAPGSLPAGRGWWVDGLVPTQVALLDADPSGPAQNAALTALAAAAAGRDRDRPARTRPQRIDPLPATITLAETMRLGAAPVVPGNVYAVVGAGGDELGPAGVDLADAGPGFVVAGPPRSGRSSALTTIAASLLAAAGPPLVVVTPRPSPLRRLAGPARVLGVVEDRDDAERLDDLVAAAAGPVVLLVDDAELLVDTSLTPVLERIVRHSRDAGHVVVATGTTADLAMGYRGWLVDARRSRSGLLLGPMSPLDGELFGLRLARGAAAGAGTPGGAASAPPGRALLVVRGVLSQVQVALPG